jgi:4-hydroxy-tetrahydrodipicolinate reductase
MKVALYGAGKVGTRVARILGDRREVEVIGPHDRDGRLVALTSGADVVLIATTSFLADVAADVRLAVEHGSNVLTTAEEAAFPWAIDAPLADELDELARAHGVSILGAGYNPGFAFDAHVLTAAGVVERVDGFRVERVVDLSGFSETVLRRLGLGFTAVEFEQGVAAGTITGHIGFPQSMRVVADHMGVELERVDRTITPHVTGVDIQAATITVPAGQTAGFQQDYVGVVDGRPWFEAAFTGHLRLEDIGAESRDEIAVRGPTPLRFATVPGVNPQDGTPAVLCNSLRRLVDAAPGWVTVGQLPPATHRA